VEPVAVRGLDFEVVVAEHPAADDMPGARLAQHRVGRALPGPLALHLVRESGHAHQQLLRRGLDCALAVLEVEEHADAGLRELLQRVGDLDRLAAEARLLGHDEDLEWGPRPERVHQPEEAGTLELRSGDPVVGVHVGIGYAPTLALGVGSGALDLAGDRLVFVGDVLVGALAGVDRRDHRPSPCRAILSSPGRFFLWFRFRLPVVDQNSIHLGEGVAR